MACLGLLCILLVATIIGLLLKIPAETSQMQSLYDNLTRETELLKNRYNLLTRHNSQLQVSHHNLTREISLLQDRFNIVADDNEKLQKRLCHPSKYFSICFYYPTVLHYVSLYLIASKMWNGGDFLEITVTVAKNRTLSGLSKIKDLSNTVQTWILFCIIFLH